MYIRVYMSVHMRIQIHADQIEADTDADIYKCIPIHAHPHCSTQATVLSISNLKNLALPPSLNSAAVHDRIADRKEAGNREKKHICSLSLVLVSSYKHVETKQNKTRRKQVHIFYTLYPALDTLCNSIYSPILQY